MPPINWIGHSALYKSRSIGDLRALNCYPEIVESRQGKTLTSLQGTPGCARFAFLPGAGPIRGLHTTSNGRCFAVQGSQLYEIMSDGTSTLRGSLLTLAGPVSMEENGLDLVLVDNPNGYSLTLSSNTFAQITDPDFTTYGAARVAFLDHYLLFCPPSGQTFFWTDPASLDFDALNIAAAEGAPDPLVSLLVIRREAWFFGTTTTEVWVATGNSNEPFARLPSGFMQHGCAARHSPARVGDTVCWLGRDEQGQGVVLAARGFVPAPISTHPVAEAIQRYAVLSDAIGWGQQQAQHLYYWLSFPNANATWVYDLTSGLWHERAYLNPATGLFERHRANCATFAFGKHLVGDHTDGRIYALDPATYTDDGGPLIFDATLPALYDTANLAPIRYDWLQIDAETGVGLDGGVVPGTDPQIALLLSEDGGHTWGPERYAPLGKQGQKQTEVRWYQLGMSPNRRFRVRISDPVPRVILGAYAMSQVLQ